MKDGDLLGTEQNCIKRRRYLASNEIKRQLLYVCVCVCVCMYVW
jgi:hypothetical protein